MKSKSSVTFALTVGCLMAAVAFSTTTPPDGTNPPHAVDTDGATFRVRWRDIPQDVQEDCGADRRAVGFLKGAGEIVPRLPLSEKHTRDGRTSAQERYLPQGSSEAARHEGIRRFDE